MSKIYKYNNDGIHSEETLFSFKIDNYFVINPLYYTDGIITKRIEFFILTIYVFYVQKLCFSHLG